MMRREELTWTCHHCKQERPDDLISAYRLDATPTWMGFGGSIVFNFRYCDDRAECLKGVMALAEEWKQRIQGEEGNHDPDST